MRSLALLALVAACNGFEVPSQPVARAHPIANAGTGSSYPLGATITLDGRDSYDPAGAIIAYRWTIAQRPTGSSAQPSDVNAMTTTFVPDQFGTYVLRLLVTDDAQHTDTSDVRIVATGALLTVDAGADTTVAWLGAAHLAGSITTVPGKTAAYAWELVTHPPGSLALLTEAQTPTPSFVADATGTYVIALHGSVGDDIGEDTVVVEATATGVSLGTGVAAYTYSTLTDRVVYVHDVGHAEAVEVDPLTGAQVAINIGAFTPRSVAMDVNGYYFAVGGLGNVVTVALTSAAFVLTGARAAPGCTASRVMTPYDGRVDCFPVDGSIEPISSVNMSTGVVTQTPSPARSPDVVNTPFGGTMYMVDSASADFYVLDPSSFAVQRHLNLAGITAPVIAVNSNQPFAMTGHGLAINLAATLRFDLNLAISAGAYATIRGELAVVSGPQLMVFGVQTGQPLKQTLILPTIAGVVPTAKLVAYTRDEHRLVLVLGTAAGDVLYTVSQ
jgi:hypothetical protein